MPRAAAAHQPAQLSDIFSTLARRKWLLLLCALLGGALAVGAWWLLPPRYAAETAVSVSPITTSVLISPEDAQRTVNMATESELARSRGVAARAVRAMGEGVTTSTMTDSVSVQNPADSLILQLTYTAGTADQAAAGANAMAEAYLEARRTEAVDQVKRLRLAAAEQLLELEEAGGQDPTDITLRSFQTQADTLGQRVADLSTIDTDPGRILGRATVPAQEIAPGPVPFGLGGAALGFLLGVPLALTRKERESSSEIGDADGLVDTGGHMVLDGTKDTDRGATWDLAALMLKLPRDLTDTCYAVVVDAGPTMGDTPAGLELVEALKRRGRPALFVDAASVNDGKISRGWPTAKKRASWVGKIVVIDSSRVPSDANKVALGTRVDAVVVARSTTDDAAALRRLTGFLLAERANLALTVLFPDRPELISLGR